MNEQPKTMTEADAKAAMDLERERILDDLWERYREIGGGTLECIFDAGAAYERERAGAEHAAAWVACSERLPEVSGEYLVQKHNGEICMRWMNVEMPDYCRRYYVAWQKVEPYAADSRDAGEGGQG